MRTILKRKGLRKAIINTVFFVAIVLIVQQAISYFLVDTEFFKLKLSIPQEFLIGTGIIRLTFFNAVIFGLVAFSVTNYKKLISIKKFKFEISQLQFYLYGLITLFLHYYLRFLINSNTDFFSQAVFFWGVIKLFLIASFLVFVYLGVFGLEFTKYFLKKFKREILLFSGITAVFFVLMLGVQSLWTFFSGAVTTILYHFFSLFYSDVYYRPFVPSITMTEGGGPLLGIHGFRAIVGKPCSGIDSFLLFTALYLLVLILDYNKINKPKAIVFFFLGAAGMFIVNVIRIFILFIVGAHVSPELAVGFFHTNMGWILFIVYFFIYWHFISKHIYNRIGVSGMKK